MVEESAVRQRSIGKSSSSEDMGSIARLIAAELADRKGVATVVIDLRGVSSFTDFFVITTATSSTHLGGLHRRLIEVLEREVLRPPVGRRHIDESGWVLIDTGPIVIHLMTADVREFYDLERLWYEGTVIYRDHEAEIQGSSSS